MPRRPAVPQMNRRQFIEGLFGATIVVAAGPIPLALESDLEGAEMQRLLEAVRKVPYINDAQTFGLAAVSWTEKWSYIRNVPYEELLATPELHRSSGDIA